MKRKFWLFSLWGALACSPPPSSVVVTQSVTVVIDSGPDKGTRPASIDLGDPRIAVAEREFKHLLGHALAFELDPALVPSFDHSLHPVFVDALERTVTQLHYLSEQLPDDFAFGKAHLTTVRWTYAPTQSPPDPALDAASGVLTIAVSSDRGSLVENGDVVRAVMDALELHRITRYDTMPAARVPAGEEREYFKFESHYHRPLPNAPKRSSDDIELARVGNVVALYPRLQDPELRRDAGEWLAMMGSRVRSAYLRTKDDPVAAQRAVELQPLWIRWLNRAAPELDDRARERIAELFFERQSAESDAFRRGFDTLGFAGPTLAAWLQHAGAEQELDSHNRTEQSVICPYSWDREHSSVTGRGYCNGALYVDVFQGAGGPQKLAALLTRTKSDLFTDTAVLQIMVHRGVPAMLELLAALDADEGASRTGLAALAAFSGFGPRSSTESDEVPLDPKPLFDRIPAWWKSRPARRPLVLLVLASLTHRYPGVVAWPELPAYLGGRVSAEEFAGFLDTRADAVSFIGDFAAGLSDGWRKSSVLIPKLDTWLTNYSRTPGDGPEPHYMTERVADLLCRVGTKADLVDLQRYLKKRIDSFPEQRNDLEVFAEEKLSELCPKVHDEKPGKKSVLFGDEG
jgi:hypothetical protein